MATRLFLISGICLSVTQAFATDLRDGHNPIIEHIIEINQAFETSFTDKHLSLNTCVTCNKNADVTGDLLYLAELTRGQNPPILDQDKRNEILQKARDDQARGKLDESNLKTALDAFKAAQENQNLWDTLIDIGSGIALDYAQRDVNDHLDEKDLDERVETLTAEAVNEQTSEGSYGLGVNLDFGDLGAGQIEGDSQELMMPDIGSEFSVDRAFHLGVDLSIQSAADDDPFHMGDLIDSIFKEGDPANKGSDDGDENVPPSEQIHRGDSDKDRSDEQQNTADKKEPDESDDDDDKEPTSVAQPDPDGDDKGSPGGGDDEMSQIPGWDLDHGGDQSDEDDSNSPPLMAGAGAGAGAGDPPPGWDLDHGGDQTDEDDGNSPPRIAGPGAGDPPPGWDLEPGADQNASNSPPLMARAGAGDPPPGWELDHGPGDAPDTGPDPHVDPHTIYENTVSDFGNNHTNTIYISIGATERDYNHHIDTILSGVQKLGYGGSLLQQLNSGGVFHYR